MAVFGRNARKAPGAPSAGHRAANCKFRDPQEPAEVMIRTVLASPWFPLLHWLAALIAVLLVAQHKALKWGPRKHDLNPPVSTLAPTPAFPHVASSTPQASHLAAQVVPAIFIPVNYWYPWISVFQLPKRPCPRLADEIAITKTPVSTEVEPLMPPPITMLSIRAGIDPSESAVANTLGIQCRTYVPISNARQRNVTIHGVVTQDVVSSAGKILIMAGSRVVGRAEFDPENGRLKSNGLWSVYIDGTEIKVQARLLDGIAGMAGMLGQGTSNEDEALQREAVVRDGRYVFVPEKASFTLEVHGDISLRDVRSKEANN